MSVERYPCDHCGEKFDGIELIPIDIAPGTGYQTTYDLCDPCCDDLEGWIRGDDDE